MLLLSLVLLFFGRIDGTFDDCSASKCISCGEQSVATVCDVVTELNEYGALYRININCTAPPECGSIAVNEINGGHCTVVLNMSGGDVESDLKLTYLYQANVFQFHNGDTCERVGLDVPLTPECTVSTNCSITTTSLEKCINYLSCRCYNDDCGASIYATVTIFNDTNTIDTTTTSTIPPSPTYTASTTATHSTSISLDNASTDGSTTSANMLSSLSMSYTSSVPTVNANSNSSIPGMCMYVHVHVVGLWSYDL